MLDFVILISIDLFFKPLGTVWIPAFAGKTQGEISKFGSSPKPGITYYILWVVRKIKDKKVYKKKTYKIQIVINTNRTLVNFENHIVLTSLIDFSI